MEKIFKKTLSLVIYIAVVVGLIYSIPRGLSYVLETPYPMAAITSGSMWPALKKGDLVFIQGVRAEEDIAVGDIVVYENSRGFTIHRAIKLKENSLITQGDANQEPDVAIKYEQVIGKTLTFKNKLVRIPKLGLIAVLTQQR